MVHQFKLTAPPIPKKTPITMRLLAAWLMFAILLLFLMFGCIGVDVYYHKFPEGGPGLVVLEAVAKPFIFITAFGVIGWVMIQGFKASLVQKTWNVLIGKDTFWEEEQPEK